MTSSGHQNSFQAKQGSQTTKNTASFYECECGKRYGAFPALYLHFSRKHNKKISSNPSPHVIRTHNTSYCQVITYLYSQTSIAQKDSLLRIDENFQKKVKVVFDDFTRSTEFEELDKGLAHHAIQHFYAYVLNILKEKKGIIEGEFYEQLPHLFNEFYLKQYGSEEKSDHFLNLWTNSIINFGTWLKKKGYTDLTVMKNQEFNKYEENI